MDTQAHGAKALNQGAGRQRMRAADRGRQVLEVATRLFAQNGFAATSMNDIAAACGVTKPVLYSHFGSKEGLFKAAMEDLGQSLADDLVLVLQVTDPTLRLKACLAVALRSIQGFGGTWPEIGAATTGGKNGMMSQIEMHRDQILAAMVNALIDLRPSELAADDVRAVCEFYIHLLYGAAICAGQWWLDTQKMDVESVQARGNRVIDAVVAQAVEEMGALRGAGQN